MAISTYAELKSSIAAWLNRTDLTDIIPDFITLAELRISKRLRSKGNMGRATTTLVVNQEYYTLPTDFIEARNIQMNTSDGVTLLKYRTPDQMDIEYSSSTPGTPEAHTIFGTEVQIRPIPDTANTLEIAYFKRLDALSDSNTTNWLTANAIDLLLYGSLIEAEPYLKDDTRMPMWKALFDEGLRALNEQEQRGRFSGSNLVARSDTQNP